MKRVNWALGVGAVVLGVGIWAAQAAPKKAAPGDKKVTAADIACPVMNEAVNFYVKTESPNGPVYFCCAMCIEKYEKNKAKYEKKVAEQRKRVAALPKVQVTCPISGDVVDGKSSTEHNGEMVQFCCPKCIDHFKKDPEKYRAKLAGSYTYQTTCPISDEPIDPKSTTTMSDGETVYFCCPKCAAKFKEEPAKYAKKLETQGYHLDLEKK
ncbi:MAG TPA: hypothetical protein VJZ71_09665 [Phycisphaerae bacterium]|nr:hypothetical protein [Phycisphaerae bacterium]